MRRVAAILFAGTLLVSACGDDDEAITTDTVVETTVSSSTTAPDEPTGTTTSSTTTTTTAAGELPGEAIDIFPAEGAVLSVVGVEADDVLNVRAGPGVSYDIVTTLAPLHTGATATGHNRLVGESFWVELDADGPVGWVNGSFVLQAAGTDDVTSALWPEVAARPSAETLVDLASVVAAEYASEDPPSRIVIVDGPTVGDLGEVTVDVIGLADDSVGGVRLHIFAEEGRDTFTVRTVEATTLCSRGVSGELCV